MPDEPHVPQSATEHRLDPRTLRALAHPLRMQILRTLREYGPATSSGLAARLGESSGATSYHLRQLAAYDFVIEDTERGTAKERWWKPAHQGTTIRAEDDFFTHPDPEVVGAASAMLYEIAATHARELNTWLGSQADWSRAWRRQGSDLSDFKLHLTPDLAQELITRLHEVIEEYRDRTPEDAEGSERVRLHLHTFPRPAE